MHIDSVEMVTGSELTLAASFRQCNCNDGQSTNSCKSTIPLSINKNRKGKIQSRFVGHLPLRFVDKS